MWSSVTSCVERSVIQFGCDYSWRLAYDLLFLFCLQQGLLSVNETTKLRHLIQLVYLGYVQQCLITWAFLKTINNISHIHLHLLKVVVSSKSKSAGGGMGVVMNGGKHCNSNSKRVVYKLNSLEVWDTPQ